MVIQIRQAGEIVVAEMNGELTWKTAPDAQRRILEQSPPGGKIILDMTGVNYMASAGLRMLLTLYRTVAGQGGTIVLAGLSENLRNTMEVTGFLEFFNHYESTDQALIRLTI